ncbi:glycosyltransferase family 9 protein [Methylacidimicrobium tartarophylax]|uniref:Heptosyltransferase I n=1 Tax=Methylacidimicrobium tartarophylax TaxID=1041768 RepID=A0A5E6MDU9_9BACT|nr:glycosyltransferase family 9 protein [Methylacidimicrobium tartarophylax]VVM07283.1 heptosyltransferase I [Methylacidimicrobium tartarophylax]
MNVGISSPWTERIREEDLPVHKILVLKFSSLGDVVQALPVAAGLRRRWPSAQIHWMAFEAYRDLLTNHPAIDRFVEFPRRRETPGGLLRDLARCLASVRGEHYDLLLDMQGLLRSGLLCLWSGARRRIGPWNGREGSIVLYRERVMPPPPPAQERYLAFLRYLRVPAGPLDYGLRAGPLDIPGLRKGAYVVLHPYARWKTKLWPWRYYRELVRSLPHLFFVAMGMGPWFPLEEHNMLDLRGALPMRRMMALLGNAAATVGPDSGPAHLAAALGVPTLILFGPTDWRESAAVGENVHVLSAAAPCAPCWRTSCPQKRPVACLADIRPTRVGEELEAICAKTLQVAQ